MVSDITNIIKKINKNKNGKSNENIQKLLIRMINIYSKMKKYSIKETFNVPPDLILDDVDCDTFYMSDDDNSDFENGLCVDSDDGEMVFRSDLDDENITIVEDNIRNSNIFADTCQHNFDDKINERKNNESVCTISEYEFSDDDEQNDNMLSEKTKNVLTFFEKDIEHDNMNHDKDTNESNIMKKSVVINREKYDKTNNKYIINT